MNKKYRGRAELHSYEPTLALRDIERRRTRIRSPRTNGFVDRMNRTLLAECFRVKGRTTWHTLPEEIRRDRDEYWSFYDFKLIQQGYRPKGRKPDQALC